MSGGNQNAVDGGLNMKTNCVDVSTGASKLDGRSDAGIIASPAALEEVGPGRSTGRRRHSSPSGLVSQKSSLQPGQ